MPDENGLPTEEELAKLPQRAIVAYAVRCARRVQPLYRLQGDHPDLRKHVAAVEQALSLSEQFAAGAAIDREQLEAAAREHADISYVTANGMAAKAADDAVKAALFYAHYAAATCAAEAAYLGYTATYTVAKAAARAANRAAAREYKQLVDLDLGILSELGEPIDATENGPLGPYWPDGLPDWYTEGLEWMRRVLEHDADDPQDTSGEEPPNDYEDSHEISPEDTPIELYIDPGNASIETIQDVFEALSELQRAAGGLGLEFHPDGLSVIGIREVVE